MASASRDRRESGPGKARSADLVCPANPYRMRYGVYPVGNFAAGESPPLTANEGKELFLNEVSVVESCTRRVAGPKQRGPGGWRVQQLWWLRAGGLMLWSRP